MVPILKCGFVRANLPAGSAARSGEEWKLRVAIIADRGALVMGRVVRGDKFRMIGLEGPARGLADTTSWSAFLYLGGGIDAFGADEGRD